MLLCFVVGVPKTCIFLQKGALRHIFLPLFVLSRFFGVPLPLIKTPCQFEYVKRLASARIHFFPPFFSSINFKKLLL